MNTTYRAEWDLVTYFADQDEYATTNDAARAIEALAQDTWDTEEWNDDEPLWWTDEAVSK